jgi:hypothetical protein
MPKDTPLLLEKTTVPLVAVWVPALIAMPPPPPEADAVIVLPFMPKETLFELENTTVPEVAELPAAEIAPGAVDCE